MFLNRAEGEDTVLQFSYGLLCVKAYKCALLWIHVLGSDAALIKKCRKKL